MNHGSRAELEEMLREAREEVHYLEEAIFQVDSATARAWLHIILDKLSLL